MNLMSQHFRIRLRAAIAAAALLLGAAPAFALSGNNTGTDFWVAFPYDAATMSVLNIYIAAGAAGATGQVSVPGAGFNQAYSAGANAVATVALSPLYALGPNGVTSTPADDFDALEEKGIHITASAPSAVYGLAYTTGTADAFLGLPTPTLGTEYWVMDYSENSNFAVVAASPGTTTVTITPATTLGFLGLGNFTTGVPYTITLNQGQTYLVQLADDGDLIGTRIQSTQPVAVFDGAYCTYIPADMDSGCCCDYLVEEALPYDSWGRNYFSLPLATRQNGDTFRVLAGDQPATVQVNGATMATLASGQYWEGEITCSAQITSDQPVCVAQFSNSQEYDSLSSDNADPFQMTLISSDSWGTQYLVASPITYFGENFLSIIAPAAALGTVTVDGSIVPASAFSPIGVSGYWGATVTVSALGNLVTCSAPVGLSVYGFDFFNGYGYPGGALLPLPTPTPTFTPTSTFTQSPTFSVTETATPTPTVTETATATPSATPTSTVTATYSATPTFTATPSATPSSTATMTYSATPTFTGTSSVTPSLSSTATPSVTPTFTATPLPFLLTPHYPNPDPAGPTGVWLPYTLSTAAKVSLTVYDISGERVRAWGQDPEDETAGAHERFWDLKNGSGRDVASGIFLVRIQGDPEIGDSQTVWERCAVVR